MKIKFFLISFLFLNFNAFSQTKLNLVEQIDRSAELLQQLSRDPQKLEVEFRQVYQFLLNVDPTDYDIRQLRRNTSTIAYKLAALQKLIGENIGSWEAQGLLTKNFEREIRSMIRATQYLTDYVAEISMDHQVKAPGENPRLAFSGGAPWTVTRDGEPMTYDKFKSGDIILMRGSSAVSASIARIADFDSLFSHVALVYVDERTKEKFLLEALIESGVVINPLKKALQQSAARMTVIRPVDENLGRKAAQIGYDLILDSIKRGKPFLYDFTMDPALPSITSNLDMVKLYCSKWIEWNYYLASEGEFRMPFVRSRMSQLNRAFLQRLKISDQTTSMFAPGDMELEPSSRFVVQAQFRDPQKTAGLRTDDLIFDKLFEWMEKDGLVFNETALMKTIGVSANRISYVPLIKKLAYRMGLPIAPHIPAEVISTVVMLQSMRGIMIKAIQPGMDEYKKRTGFQAPPKIVYQLLDQAYQSSPDQLKFLVKPSAARSCRAATAR